MRIFAALSILLVGLIQACTKGQAPMPGEQVQLESVSLVLYYSDGDWDWKTTGEKLLLNTGELLTVPRKVIRPDEYLITGDWNNTFLPAINAPPSKGFQDLKLDRVNGVLCNAERCAYVKHICPPIFLTKSGAKCHSYLKR